jgi:hypothetical protein
MYENLKILDRTWSDEVSVYNNAPPARRAITGSTPSVRSR